MKYTKKSNKKKGNFKNINDFSCFLINNNNIKNFAFDIFYKLLIFWKNNYPTKWKSIISPLIKEKKEKNIISLIGFNSSEIITIFKYLKDKSKLFEFFNDKFLKVTSSIRNLCEPILTIYIVNKNKFLQEKFIVNLNKLLLSKDFTWNNFYHIYKVINNKKLKILYNIFVFDIIFGIDKDKKKISIYRLNLNNMNFFRTKKNINNKIDPKKYLKNLNKCTKSIIGNNTYKKYKIYNSKKKFNISFNSPYAKIMQFYNQNYLSGPSGTAPLLYIMLFDFYNIIASKRNKILLLGLIIADFTPLWHSLNEILLTSYSEIKSKKIKKYNLKKSAINYSYKLLKPYL